MNRRVRASVRLRMRLCGSPAQVRMEGERVRFGDVIVLKQDELDSETVRKDKCVLWH